MNELKLVSVNVGGAKKIAAQDRTFLSAIGKRALQGPVNVGRMGLLGDEQADLSVHGGLSKAIYAYPVEHYPFWREQRKQHGVSLFDEDLPSGFMGENLTLSGLLESEVYIGDELHFPECTLRVTEPRSPCFKFNAVMGFNQAGKVMAKSGFCGFYLAVEKAGSLQADQLFTLQPGRRSLGVSQAFDAKMGKHLR
jgi:MOSC domain-containing protein YiiM